MIKLQFTIDLGNPDEVAEAIRVLEQINGKPEAAKPKAEKPKAEKPKAAPAKKAKAKEETDDDMPSIEKVRATVSKKVGDHRQAIKKQLTELGANNVSSLDSDKYADFLAFLEDLE